MNTGTGSVNGSTARMKGGAGPDDVSQIAITPAERKGVCGREDRDAAHIVNQNQSGHKRKTQHELNQTCIFLR
eukprot:1048332-Rhodomonas_salina.1